MERSRFRLPRFTGALTVRRRVAGLIVALLGTPLLTFVLVLTHTEESLAVDVLCFQLLVVVVALIGGFWPALAAAILSGVSLDFFLVSPELAITVAEPIHFLALAVFVVVAALVSLVVDAAARRSRIAAKAIADAQFLSTVAGGVLRGEDTLQAMVTTVRVSFGLTGVRLLAGDTVLASDGEPTPDEKVQTVAVGDRAVLELSGRELDAAAWRLLDVVVAQTDAALEHRELAATASEVEPLERADRVRSALLAAVGHDLRRPLAVATTAVSSLRAGGRLSEQDRRALLASAEESLASLSQLLTNLLDVSRVQAGVLAVSAVDLDIDDLLPSVLDEMHLSPGDVDLALDAAVPRVFADPVLLQRVLVNLLANAVRFSPADRAPRVSAGPEGDRIAVRVIDHGPGIPPERLSDVFQPFQRLGDTDNLTGIGLGLALSKGFVEGMGGTLTPEPTPGGGLTMVVALPPSPRMGRP